MKAGTFFPALILLAVFSCKKDKPAVPAPDLGLLYFPLITGNYIIYDVDSAVHDDFKDSVIRFTYQVKELVESEFTDNAGKVNFRMERYKRSQPADAWILTDVWAAHVNTSRAERFEENTWYVKMIFPVKQNAQWNGNAFNSLEEMEYEYIETHITETLSGKSYDSVTTVLQADDKNAISRLYAVEKYAKNIGMVYKEYINLDLQRDSGLVMTMTLNSYGN